MFYERRFLLPRAGFVDPSLDIERGAPVIGASRWRLVCGSAQRSRVRLVESHLIGRPCAGNIADMPFPCPTPRTCLDATLALALCAALGTACATSRVGDAEVRLQEGQPCFTISAKEAARGPTIRLQAVMVSDVSVSPVAEVWSVLLDAQRLETMSSASCFAYGQAPDGASARPAPAPMLQPGRVYQVYLNIRSSDRSDPTRGYLAKFCLAADPADPSGPRRLMPVLYGTRAWDEGFCR
ncbi:hypothetical protein [Roseateles sp.]|uniref:hypothetical protein n=1 Tax=Roseateles sp. TaxID=1971397 RepID=UPI0031E28676